MPRQRIVILFLLLSFSLAWSACALKTPRLGSSAGQLEAAWKLSENAQSIYQYLLFQEAKREHNATVAEGALKESLKMNPSPGLYLEAAEFYWRQGLPDQTRQILKEGMERYPEEENLVLLLAGTYLTDNRYQDALFTLHVFLKTHPDNLAITQELIRIYIQQERFADALDVVKQTPKELRYLPVMRYYAAKAYSGLGSHKLATAELSKAIKDNPDFVEAWAELAYQYEMIKDYTAAEQTYTRILELGETSQEIWLRLIDLNLKLNNPDRALNLVRQGPDTLSFQLTAVSEFIDDGFFDQAGQILEPLTPEAEQEPAIYFYLALLAYEGRSDAPAALDFLSKVPSSNLYYERALRFQVHLLEDLKRYDEAFALVKQGQQLFPDKTEFWVLEARLYESQNQLDTALKLLDEAESKWPEDTTLLYTRGMILERNNRLDEAMQVMEHIITLDPENADALNYVGYTLADAKKDLDRAYVLIHNALVQEPDNGYIIDSLAWVHFRQGKFKDAWEAIRRAVEKIDSDPTIWEHYGDIASALGLTKDARKAYEKSLSLGTKKKHEIRKKMKQL